MDKVMDDVLEKLITIAENALKVYEAGGSITVDQTYNSESENAQSGKAVAEAMKTVKIPSKVSELENDLDLINRTTMNDMTSLVYDKLDDEKADKPTVINISSPTYAFEFSNLDNRVVCMESAESISFTFGDGEYPNIYMSSLSFDSGETPTAIDYTGSGILNWVGVDCVNNDGLSIFQPSANKHYDIVFDFNGTQFIGLVNGFVPATGNVVSE